MKKKFLIAASILSLTLAGAFLAGCRPDEEVHEKPPAPPVVQNQGIIDGTQEGFDEPLYTYTFSTGEGSEVPGGTLYKNEFLLKPQDPVRAGYKFTGWYFDEACTLPAEFVNYKMPARDVTFYAGWEKYRSISFNTMGGEPMDPLLGEEGEPVGTVQTPVYDGYIFEGWFSDEACTQSYTFNTFPSGDITVYAKWHQRRENVSVTFSDNGKTSGGLYREGDVIPLGTGTPQDEYLDFAGWLVDTENNRLVKDSYTVTDKDTTLTASYQTKREWAKITIQPSMYLKEAYREDGVSFYAKKGEPLSAGDHTFEEYKQALQSGQSLYELLFDDSSVQPQRISYLGLMSTRGVAFDPEKDMVIGNMDLVPDFASVDLKFTPIYIVTQYPLLGYLYGEEGIREYLEVGPDEDLSEDQLDQFTKMYYAVSGYELHDGITEIYVPDNHAEPEDKDPYPVIMVEEGALKGLETITKVRLSATTQLIEANAFEGCLALREIVLPETLAEIGDSAFKGCTALSAVNIPQDLLTFGYKVFEDTAFETALFNSTQGNNVFINDGQVLYGYKGQFTPFPVLGNPHNLMPGTGDEGHLLVVNADCYSIAGGAFANQTGLGWVAISGSVELIGNGAFRGCTNLVTFISGANTRYILEDVFRDCTNLVQFLQNRNSDPLVEIGARAFMNCTSLVGYKYEPPASGEAPAGTITYDYFYFGFNLTTLGESVFEGCTSLSHIEMARLSVLDGPTLAAYESTKVNYIPRNAFKGCTSLVDIRIMNEVVEIASGAFEGCTSLETVYLGDVAVSQYLPYPLRIRTDAFKGCENLHRLFVTLPATDENSLLIFDDGCFDENYPYFFIRVSSRSGMTLYQESCEMYADHFTVSSPIAPTLRVEKEWIQLATTSDLLIDGAFIKEYASATDNTDGAFELTQAEDLVWSVTSVVFNRPTSVSGPDGTTQTTYEQVPVEGTNGHYDLSTAGRYTVTFSVADKYGMATSGTFYLVMSAPQS